MERNQSLRCCATGDDFGPKFGRMWRETDEAGANRSTMVRNLLEGQYENPVCVVAFKRLKAGPRDVTIDIADELGRRYIKHYSLKKKSERRDLIKHLLQCLEGSPGLARANEKKAKRDKLPKDPWKERKLPIVGD